MLTTASNIPSEVVTITSAISRDIRFPTSLTKDGSDAMNESGDYSSAYCILSTNSSSGLQGHGMTFTIGRGNDIVCRAIEAVAARIVGRTLQELIQDMGKTWRYLVADSQLRWIGPEKGVIHLALGAVVNAVWDLWAKSVGKPVWRVVADMTPGEFVGCVDWRYLEDAITREEAVQMLQEMEVGKRERVKEAEGSRAVPAYTTSAGYGEDKMKALLEETLAEGYKHFKLKVGGNLEQDMHRLSIAREVLGYDNGNVLMVDANQVWSVPEAIDYMKKLAKFKPWFIEEPTSPDDILGHKAIREALKEDGIEVATGEMCQNRVIFKQLLSSGAIGICQIDACRLGGVNEVMAVLLLAKKFGVPVVPHSGGVGLPEYTQHLSTIDYVCVSGKKSLLEFVDHLHEHFIHPSVIKDGYYTTPTEPGYSVQMKEASMDEFEFPGGAFWQSETARPIRDHLKTDRPI
ncbi:Similar to Mitochondrial enolase superfamily member 1; acc. no. Q6INX4 [Pyronema omphalodes CBS 100304]|uniref:Similar to Mitochondrial enolase superfamily member 1 acc. no. Q6INX4 n=1 Tax=Pyronema omphalodes (strain CBS 100304) TaxID=1076935 RepID=U4L2U8_PYROM|nr:Similar to Mitochondrial enolase superfamily member 1; acc. no. Q6INX4 [Pyronema omphalodes CBS 100304]